MKKRTYLVLQRSIEMFIKIRMPPKIKKILKQSIFTIVCCIIIVPVILSIYLSINIEYPNIILHNGILEERELSNNYVFKTAGYYSPFTNTISININNSKDEVIHILYHEYGHYIYKNLEKEYKIRWKKDFCKEEEREGYYKFQLCEEEFADGLADYLAHKMDTIKKWEYFDNITNTYFE